MLAWSNLQRLQNRRCCYHYLLSMSQKWFLRVVGQLNVAPLASYPPLPLRYPGCATLWQFWWGGAPRDIVIVEARPTAQATIVVRPRTESISVDYGVKLMDPLPRLEQWESTLSNLVQHDIPDFKRRVAALEQGKQKLASKQTSHADDAFEVPQVLRTSAKGSRTKLNTSDSATFQSINTRH